MTHMYHNHCEHRSTMKHCTHCDQAYCTSCGKNWTYSSWNQPVYYCGTVGAGTGTTLSNTAGNVTEITNTKHDH